MKEDWPFKCPNGCFPPEYPLSVVSEKYKLASHWTFKICYRRYCYNRYRLAIDRVGYLLAIYAGVVVKKDIPYNESLSLCGK